MVMVVVVAFFYFILFIYFKSKLWWDGCDCGGGWLWLGWFDSCDVGVVVFLFGFGPGF